MSMQRKPLSLVVMAVSLYLAPAVILLFNAMLSMVPLWGPGSILSRLGLADIIVLALYPLAGFAVWRVRPWGWYLIAVAILGLVVYNFWAWYRNAFVDFPAVLMATLGLFALVAFFFQKHVIAPYFNPRLRWWEQAERLTWDMSLGIPLLGFRGAVKDISRSGCYVSPAPALGDTGGSGGCKALLTWGRYQVELRVTLMRQVNVGEGTYGYGFMFHFDQASSRRAVESLIASLGQEDQDQSQPMEGREQRRETRFRALGHLGIVWGGSRGPVRVHDLSMTGAALYTTMSSEDTTITFHFLHRGNEVTIPARILWQRPMGLETLLGIRFLYGNASQRGHVKALLAEARTLGASPRDRSRKVYRHLLNQSLDRTPYRWIRALRRRIGLGSRS